MSATQTKGTRRNGCLSTTGIPGRRIDQSSSAFLASRLKTCHLLSRNSVAGRRPTFRFQHSGEGCRRLPSDGLMTSPWNR
jgi:hypothetical protein